MGKQIMSGLVTHSRRRDVANPFPTCLKNPKDLKPKQAVSRRLKSY